MHPPATRARARRGIDSVARSFGWFLVPALPVWCGLNFGTRGVSALAGLVVAETAAW